MPKGDYTSHLQYFQNPNVKKPVEAIYWDLQRFVNEFFEDETHLHSTMSIFVFLPPLFFDGQFIKGICTTMASDFIAKRYPHFSDIFHLIANSMGCSYSWSTLADAFFTLYPNPRREAWFRRTHPDQANKIFIPLQDADYTNEYFIAPVPNVEKDLDVICVSRLDRCKNLPLIAESLKIYHRKFGQKIKMTLIIGKEVDLNWTGLDEVERGILYQIEEILIHPNEYIHFVPRVPYHEISTYYSRSKLCVMGSLLEGKNRSIYESISCNIPLVCFKQFNQYIRNDHPVFPEGAGMYADFDPEALADTFHEVLTHYGDFKPRQGYLKTFGRRRFLQQCMDAFPGYRTQIPDYDCFALVDNPWLDAAMQLNYGMSLTDFIYDKNTSFSYLYSINTIDRMMNYYIHRFLPLAKKAGALR